MNQQILSLWITINWLSHVIKSEEVVFCTIIDRCSVKMITKNNRLLLFGLLLRVISFSYLKDDYHNSYISILFQNQSFEAHVIDQITALILNDLQLYQSIKYYIILSVAILLQYLTFKAFQSILMLINNQSKVKSKEMFLYTTYWLNPLFIILPSLSFYSILSQYILTLSILITLRIMTTTTASKHNNSNIFISILVFSCLLLLRSSLFFHLLSLYMIISALTKYSTHIITYNKQHIIILIYTCIISIAITYTWTDIISTTSTLLCHILYTCTNIYIPQTLILLFTKYKQPITYILYTTNPTYRNLITIKPLLTDVAINRFMMFLSTESYNTYITAIITYITHMITCITNMFTINWVSSSGIIMTYHPTASIYWYLHAQMFESMFSYFQWLWWSQPWLCILPIIFRLSAQNSNISNKSVGGDSSCDSYSGSGSNRMSSMVSRVYYAYSVYEYMRVYAFI